MTTAPPTAVPLDLARETDADLLRRTATLMRQSVADLRDEMIHNTYWAEFDAEHREDIAYAEGIRCAAGGPGGDFAARWSLSAALATADLLDRVADEIDTHRTSMQELGLGALMQPTALNPVWAAALGMAHAYLNETTTTEGA